MSSGFSFCCRSAASSGVPRRSTSWKKALTCTSISAWFLAVAASVLVTSTSTPCTAKMLVSTGPAAHARAQGRKERQRHGENRRRGTAPQDAKNDQYAGPNLSTRTPGERLQHFIRKALRAKDAATGTSHQRIGAN